MNHFIVRAVAEGGGDLVGFQALDALDFLGGVVRQTAGKFLALAVVERYDVAFAKCPFDADDADRQQAAALLLDRAAGSVVEDQIGRAAGR